jgi:uncharacterized membrane protein
MAHFIHLGAVAVALGTGLPLLGQNEGGMAVLPGLSREAFDTVAAGISADGTVIVGYASLPLVQEVYRWTASGAQSLGGPRSFGGPIARANAVSADGLTVGGEFSEYHPYPLPVWGFVWSEAAGYR